MKDRKDKLKSTDPEQEAGGKAKGKGKKISDMSPANLEIRPEEAENKDEIPEGKDDTPKTQLPDDMEGKKQNKKEGKKGKSDKNNSEVEIQSDEYNNESDKKVRGKNRKMTETVQAPELDNLGESLEGLESDDDETPDETDEEMPTEDQTRSDKDNGPDKSGKIKGKNRLKNILKGKLEDEDKFSIEEEGQREDLEDSLSEELDNFMQSGQDASDDEDEKGKRKKAGNQENPDELELDNESLEIDSMDKQKDRGKQSRKKNKSGEADQEDGNENEIAEQSQADLNEREKGKGRKMAETISEDEQTDDDYSDPNDEITDKGTRGRKPVDIPEGNEDQPKEGQKTSRNKDRVGKGRERKPPAINENSPDFDDYDDETGLPDYNGDDSSPKGLIDGENIDDGSVDEESEEETSKEGKKASNGKNKKDKEGKQRELTEMGMDENEMKNDGKKRNKPPDTDENIKDMNEILPDFDYEDDDYEDDEIISPDFAKDAENPNGKTMDDAESEEDLSKERKKVANEKTKKGGKGKQKDQSEGRRDSDEERSDLDEYLDNISEGYDIDENKEDINEISPDFDEYGEYDDNAMLSPDYDNDDEGDAIDIDNIDDDDVDEERDKDDEWQKMKSSKKGKASDKNKEEKKYKLKTAPEDFGQSKGSSTSMEELEVSREYKKDKTMDHDDIDEESVDDEFDQDLSKERKSESKGKNKKSKAKEWEQRELSGMEMVDDKETSDFNEAEYIDNIADDEKSGKIKNRNMKNPILDQQSAFIDETSEMKEEEEEEYPDDDNDLLTGEGDKRKKFQDSFQIDKTSKRKRPQYSEKDEIDSKKFVDKDNGEKRNKPPDIDENGEDINDMSPDFNQDDETKEITTQDFDNDEKNTKRKTMNIDTTNDESINEEFGEGEERRNMKSSKKEKESDEDKQGKKNKPNKIVSEEFDQAKKISTALEGMVMTPEIRKDKTMASGEIEEESVDEGLDENRSKEQKKATNVKKKKGKEGKLSEMGMDENIDEDRQNTNEISPDFGNDDANNEMISPDYENEGNRIDVDSNDDANVDEEPGKREKMKTLKKEKMSDGNKQEKKKKVKTVSEEFDESKESSTSLGGLNMLKENAGGFKLDSDEIAEEGFDEDESKEKKSKNKKDKDSKGKKKELSEEMDEDGEPRDFDETEYFDNIFDDEKSGEIEKNRNMKNSIFDQQSDDEEYPNGRNDQTGKEGKRKKFPAKIKTDQDQDKKGKRPQFNEKDGNNGRKFVNNEDKRNKPPYIDENIQHMNDISPDVDDETNNEMMAPDYDDEGTTIDIDTIDDDDVDEGSDEDDKHKKMKTSNKENMSDKNKQGKKKKYKTVFEGLDTTNENTEGLKMGSNEIDSEGDDKQRDDGDRRQKIKSNKENAFNKNKQGKKKLKANFEEFDQAKETSTSLGGLDFIHENSNEIDERFDEGKKVSNTKNKKGEDKEGKQKDSGMYKGNEQQDDEEYPNGDNDLTTSKEGKMKKLSESFKINKARKEKRPKTNAMGEIKGRKLANKNDGENRNKPPDIDGDLQDMNDISPDLNDNDYDDDEMNASDYDNDEEIDDGRKRKKMKLSKKEKESDKNKQEKKKKPDKTVSEEFDQLMGSSTSLEGLDLSREYNRGKTLSSDETEEDGVDEIFNEDRSKEGKKPSNKKNKKDKEGKQRELSEMGIYEENESLEGLDITSKIKNNETMASDEIDDEMVDEGFDENESKERKKKRKKEKDKEGKQKELPEMGIDEKNESLKGLDITSESQNDKTLGSDEIGDEMVDKEFDENRSKESKKNREKKKGKEGKEQMGSDEETESLEGLDITSEIKNDKTMASNEIDDEMVDEGFDEARSKERKKASSRKKKKGKEGKQKELSEMGIDEENESLEGLDITSEIKNDKTMASNEIDDEMVDEGFDEARSKERKKASNRKKKKDKEGKQKELSEMGIDEENESLEGLDITSEIEDDKTMESYEIDDQEPDENEKRKKMKSPKKLDKNSEGKKKERNQKVSGEFDSSMEGL